MFLNPFNANDDHNRFKSLLYRMKCVFEHRDLQMLSLKLISYE